MIYEVLKILRKEASNYLPGEDLVVLDNIAKIEEGNNGNLDKVFLTMLSLEEEATLKNKPNHKVVNGQKVFKSTPAYLNMYVMFAANRSTYKDALENINAIVELFQNKNYFTPTNTPNHDTGLSEFKFTIDLSSLKFEQLSYVWGVLGGKVMPSAFYKVSIIKVEKEIIKQKRPLVTSIEGALNNK